MGMVGNVARDHAGEQLHDQIALGGRMEVEEGMNALRGTSRAGVAGTGHGTAGAGTGEYGPGVGDHQEGYGAGTGAATGVGDATGKPVSGYGTNEYSGSPGVVDAKGQNGSGFIRPGDANASKVQHRPQEDHLGPTGGTEHPDSLQHTSAAPPPTNHPEEEGSRGSTAPQTGKQPPPGTYNSTENRPGVHPPQDLYDGRYYAGEEAGGGNRAT
jgi:hypothetical protein